MYKDIVVFVNYRRDTSDACCANSLGAGFLGTET
jgi:hypothetical protein